MTSARYGASAGILLGGFLGMGAPLGALILRLFTIGSFTSQTMAEEIQSHLFFYLYMIFSTPVVFAAFGYYLGLLRDRLAEQNLYLSKINVILERQSMIDEVTGLANRRFLDFEMDREIERARRRGQPIAGLMMDIDDFKEVNDRHGHLAGDLVLAHVASVTRQSLRRVDIAGRYGGDEFLVILPDANAEAARVVAERVQKNMRVSRVENAPHLGATVSIGLFTFTDVAALDKTTFIDRIDLALLKAKQAGKDRIVSG